MAWMRHQHPPSHLPPLASTLGTQRSQSPHLPGAGAQFLEAGEGVDGPPTLPLLPAHPQLLQAPQLLHLGLKHLYLSLKALNGLCQPEEGTRMGAVLRGQGQPPHYSPGSLQMEAHGRDRQP
jgi:hypothetical protein